jgi:hypothetical protein
LAIFVLSPKSSVFKKQIYLTIFALSFFNGFAAIPLSGHCGARPHQGEEEVKIQKTSCGLAEWLKWWSPYCVFLPGFTGWEMMVLFLLSVTP